MASSAPASASSSTGSKGSDGDSDKSRVLVIGASGAVGKAVMGALETLDNVEVITASRSSGTHRVDATDDAVRVSIHPHGLSCPSLHTYTPHLRCASPS